MILTSLKVVFDSKGWIYEEDLSITMPNLDMQVSAELIRISGWLITTGKRWREEMGIHILAERMFGA